MTAHEFVAEHAERLHGVAGTVGMVALVITAVCKLVLVMCIIHRRYRNRRHS